MKLTWFGGTALRAYVGGEIIVIDPEAAPPSVDRGELLAGADRVLRLAHSDAQLIDADRWRPAVARPLEPIPPVRVLSVGLSTLLVSAASEPPLLITDVPDLPHLGRWADAAVFVLLGEPGARLAETIVDLDIVRPKLLAIAAAEEVVDALFEKLATHPNVPNLVSLEPGLALEV